MKTNSEKIVAVIPVKLKSDRVPSKNFREFIEGKSLFQLLVEKLLLTQKFDKIYVSSNAEEIKSEVEELGCIFVPRKEKYCNNEIPWSDVIYEVVKSIPEDDDVSIAWCHTTSPLFDNYDLAIKKYFEVLHKNTYDGLISVTPISEFIVSENRQPINYSWGPWHKYSQHLDKLYAITGALFIAKKREMLLNRYVISKNPLYFEVLQYEAIDIDTTYDFELAKILFKNLKTLRKYV
jgi:CMP-N-acetylneuraminic acid synthetase